jgi:ElaB/YqjD/DUF883 family membrane-anchored ribosome-binding protein
MGQSAEELRYEIAETREQLGGTLDAIGDRVSPGRMMERRKNRFMLGARNVRDRVMGTVEQGADRASSATDAVREAPELVRERTEGNPMAAGAMAFGVGFLVASVLPVSRLEEQAAPRVAGAVGPLQEELTEAGREVAENLKEPAKAAVGEVQQAASDGAQALKQEAKGAAEQATDQGRQAAQQVREA